MKSKTNISIVDNAKIRRKSDIIIGKKGEYSSGDILDANAVSELVDGKVGDVADTVKAITDMAPENLDTLKEAADAIVDLQESVDNIPDIPALPVDRNKFQAVDLGLPSGTLWSNLNVGATSTYGTASFGNFYMYGHGNKTFLDVLASQNTGFAYTGTEDPLSLDVDPARAIMGGTWHVPTKLLVEELIENTTISKYTVGGVLYVRFAGKNGKTIAFPIAGYYLELSGVGSKVDDCGIIMTSTPSDNLHYYTLNISKFSDGADINWNGTRTYGVSVRGVLDTKVSSFHKVAITGDYNDLENKPTIPDALILVDWNQTDSSTKDYIKNKPTIPNVAVVNLEPEDLNMSTTPYVITNQDKISLICDLLDSKTSVIGVLTMNQIESFIFYTMSGSFNGTDLQNVAIDAVLASIGNQGFGLLVGAARADVTSRYVTSNTGS